VVACLIVVAANNTHSDTTHVMAPSDEIAALAADPQILDRLAVTFTPRGVSHTAGEAVALQLASAGSPATNILPSGLHIGYTAVAPLTTAALFRYVGQTCGKPVALLGCEAATRTHAVGTGDTNQGPQRDPDVRLTIYDATGHASADLRATIVRAIMSDAVAVATDTHYQLKLPTGVIAVGQTLAAADPDPFDARIAACLDCVVSLERSRTPTDGTSAPDEPAAPDSAPLPEALRDEYLEAVWATTPTVTTAARERWESYKTAQGSVESSTWKSAGSLSSAETVPKLAASLARLELAETVTAEHTTTAIEWFESVSAHPAATESCGDELSSAHR